MFSVLLLSPASANSSSATASSSAFFSRYAWFWLAFCNDATSSCATTGNRSLNLDLSSSALTRSGLCGTSISARYPTAVSNTRTLASRPSPRSADCNSSASAGAFSDRAMTVPPWKSTPILMEGMK